MWGAGGKKGTKPSCIPPFFLGPFPWPIIALGAMSAQGGVPVRNETVAVNPVLKLVRHSRTNIPGIGLSQVG